MAYVLNRHDFPFRKIQDAFPFPEAYADRTPIHHVLSQALMEEPPGIILFGYKDATSMKPVLDILDKIPEVPYGTIETGDGRKLYCISHWAAQEHLFNPREIGMSPAQNIFDAELISALSNRTKAHDRVTPSGQASLKK